MWERWRFPPEGSKSRKPVINVIGDGDFANTRKLVMASPLWLIAIDTKECLLAVAYEPAGHAASYLYIKKGEATTS